MKHLRRLLWPVAVAGTVGVLLAGFGWAAASLPVALVAFGLVGEAASRHDGGISLRLLDRLDLQRLRWIAILLPGITIIIVDVVLYMIHQAEPLPHEIEHVAFGAVLFIASIPFAAFVFAAVSRIQREMLSHREQIAVMEERERIAREMHDNFGQVLGYINTKAQATLLMCEEQRFSDAHAQIRQLEEATRNAYGEVREAILGLRSTMLLGGGLVPALEQYGQRFAEQAGVELSFRNGLPKRVSWSPEVEIQIFRVVQEALANVRKHAGATAVTIEVTPVAAGVEFAVLDDGCGFEDHPEATDDAHSFGLSTMRERADIIAGQLTIQSRDGAGTRVVLRVPSALMRKRV